MRSDSGLKSGQVNEKEKLRFTAELAENAEEKILNILCELSDLCGESLLREVPGIMKFNMNEYALA
jgi:hypothetical protein